jgi:RNA polymerase sigma-70 factor (sigma-E family)
MADEAAFNDFVVARTPALTRTAYLLTHDHQLAEDLVQTALFKAARAWDRIEGEPEPYVRRILYTENISRWRRRRHLIETYPPGYDAPAAAGPDPDVHVSLERALGRLTVRQRTVLVLRYYEDLTEAETAQVLGCAVGTVKAHAHHALRALRRGLAAGTVGEVLER